VDQRELHLLDDRLEPLARVEPEREPGRRKKPGLAGAPVEVDERVVAGPATRKVRFWESMIA
jgi:hypothetical protein